MRPVRAWPLAALLALLAVGCADEIEYAQPEDLLARTDLVRVIDEPPREATLEDGLGPLQDAGWAAGGREHAGRAAAVASGRRARLDVSAGPPRDRVVRLALAMIGSSALTVADVNGHRIELGIIDETWREVSFEVPASLWVEGSNAIDLELPITAVDIERRDSPRLAVASFELGPPSDSGAARDALGVDEGYDLLLAGVDGARFRGRTDVRGSGTLELALHPVRPANGEVDPDPIAIESIPLQDGAWDWDATLGDEPEAAGLTQLELRWRPDDEDSTARIERLELRRRASGRPELVLFLSADTLSARSLSLYGYNRPTSPELDRLAEDAIVFERAIANSGWTLPSYASQLSGLRPGAIEFTPSNRHGRAAPWETFQLPPGRITIQQLYAALGYDTAAIVDSTLLAKLQGFDRGFATVDASPSTIPPTDPAGGMELAARLALDRIDARDPDRPLFLMLQVVDVHGPYVTRAPWSEQFRSEDDGRDALVVANLIKAPGTVHRYIADGLEPGAERVPISPLRDAYDAKVLELDDRIGDLVAALEQRELWDETLFVLSADHGESMDEQGLYFRHGTAQQSVVQVPLVLRLPEGERGGRRVSDQVALVDLLPTFAELAGLDPEPFELHGRSLLERLEPDARGSVPAIVQTEFLAQRAVVDGRWKLVRSEPWNDGIGGVNALYMERYWQPWSQAFPEWAAVLMRGLEGDGPPPVGGERLAPLINAERDALNRTMEFFRERGPDLALYDLDRDPEELTDVSAEHPDQVARLLALLEEAEAEDARARAEVGGVPAPAALDASDLERLAELGYADAPADEPPLQREY